VFFDGLDEVSERDEVNKRTVIKEAIVAFAGPLAATQIVVTSRNYAYRRDDAWRLPGEQFLAVKLDLFGPLQIKTFVHAWYRMVGPVKGWDERNSSAEADSLARAIQSLTHLRELARYPLLLTLMAQVHGRDGTLPEDRADLYERAVELLLMRWENRLVRDDSGQWTVAPGLIQRLDLRLELVRGALGRVAFAAHFRCPTSQSRG
jgi:predicted NACHT family NTPase